MILLTNGLIFSQPLLLALVQKGITREDSYALVQGVAMKCWETGDDFLLTVKNDENIGQHLSGDEIDNCFDLKHQLRNVDHIFKRAHLID